MAPESSVAHECQCSTTSPAASVFQKLNRRFNLLYSTEKTLKFGDLCMITRCRDTNTGKRRVCKTYYKRDLNHFDACSSFIRQTYRHPHQEDQSIVSQVVREAEIMASLHNAHPHLLASIAAYESDEAFHIVMDFCEQGTLSDKVKQLATACRSYKEKKYYPYNESEEKEDNDDHTGLLAEEEAVRIFRELAQAVLFLHDDRKIAHRDIKCDNVFLRHDGSVQLGDFGLAENCCLSDGSPHLFYDFAGSLEYMAPEVLHLTAHPKEDTNMDATGYDARLADVWSMGVVLFHMLTGGAYPYESIDDSSMVELYEAMTSTSNASNRIMWSTIEDNYGVLARDLVSWMLFPDPHGRPSIQQVLLHPWLNEELHQQNMINMKEENYIVSPSPSSEYCSTRWAQQQQLNCNPFAMHSCNDVHRSKKRIADQRASLMRWQHICMKDKLYSIIKKKAAACSSKFKKHHLPDRRSAQQYADHLNTIRRKYGISELSCNTAAFMSTAAPSESTPSPAAPAIGAVMLIAC